MIIPAIVDKEFRQIFRDWQTLIVLLVIPMFLLIMFGYAISLDVKNVGLAIVDYDHSTESARLIRSLQHSEYFVITEYLQSVNDVDRGILTDRETAALVIPRGFTRTVLRGETATVQLLVDGSNGTSASAILGYLQSIVGEFGAEVAARDGITRTPLVGVEARVWFNPELESSQFLVPGLAAFILIITAVVSTALSVVREKELGTLEQIAVSPIRPIQLVIGKTIPYTVISAIVAATVFASAAALFGVQSAGGYASIAIITLLYLFACIGFGVMISSMADSQQVAFLLSLMITFLPSFILSGFVFPIDNMPPAIQVVTYLVPARYYLTALRAIMLRGAGVAFYWKDIVLLALFATTTIAIGVRRLRTGSELA